MIAKYRKATHRLIAAALGAGQAIVSAVRGYRFRLIADLYRAADNTTPVEISYVKDDGSASVRIIEPASPTVTRAGHVIVRAHDRSRGENRTFRIDRIVGHRLAPEAA